LLTGLTSDGTEVPVQVDQQGRLVAEGLQGMQGIQGPEGPQGPVGPQGPQGPQSDASNWTRTGTELSPKTAGDTVFIHNDVKIGNTTAAPNILFERTGGITAKHGFLKVIDSTGPATGGTIQLGTDEGISYVDAFSPDPGKWQNMTLRGTDVVMQTAIKGVIPIDRVRLTSVGDFCIGGTLPSSPNITLKTDGNINVKGAAARVYADNATATAAGLASGDVYRTATGQLMIAF